MPKFALWILQSAMKMSSAGKLFGFCIDYEKIQAKGKIQCHCRNGKCKYDCWNLLESNLKDSDFEKTFKKGTSIDPFEFAYENFLNVKDFPEGFALKGTIEEDGRTIDVLIHTSMTQIGNGKIQNDTTLLYVVEEDWGILRKVDCSAGGVTRMECRNLGDGIWLPISYVDDPTVVDMNEVMKDGLKQAENEETMSRLERKLMTRIRDIANGKRKFHPCITMCYNINYK